MALLFGSLAYLAAKVAGYSFYAKYLNWLFDKQINIWKVGAARTVLGIVLGLVHNGLMFSTLNVAMGRSPIGGEDTLVYIASLVFLRILEWGIIIYWFYTRTLSLNARTVKGISLGVIWSFILDIPIWLGIFTVIATIC